MPRTDADARFERRTEAIGELPTLIVGMPENGVVGSIAVDQITEQLDLEHTGHIVSETFPPVATFGDGWVRDIVRVYAGTDPNVVIPHCDIALPPYANADLAACVVHDLATDFDRAIVLAGVPAQSEEQVGEVTGLVTSEDAANELRDIDVPLDTNVGFLGGASGAVLNECYHANIPTIALIVKAHPYLPDPEAARAVIKEALEPLVNFDINTQALEEKADEIRTQMEQIANHYEQLMESYEGRTPEDSMFQ